MGTISKSLNLLNYFSDKLPEIGLTEFKKLTRQDKATLHRHLTELEANGFLEQNPNTRKYRLGATLLRLASVRESTFPAKKIVSHLIKKLAEESNELVHASLLQKNAMSPLCFHDGGSGGTRVYFNEADILPLHATASGLAALSFGPPQLFESINPNSLNSYTDFTITDKSKLTRKIQEIRSAGYVYADQSFEAEVCSFAAPFFENNDYAYGAISIAIPRSRIDKIDKTNFINLLWKTADKITRELGGQTPKDIQKSRQLAA